MRAYNYWGTNVMPKPEAEALFGDIRACPFCASQAVGLWVRGMPHVTCGNCGADGPAVDGDSDRHVRCLQAVHLWNARMGERK